jgi:hypothetical protein
LSLGGIPNNLGRVSERQNSIEKIKSLLDTDELAPLESTPRSSRESLSNLENCLRQIFSETKFPDSAQPLIRSLILLWHDYLDESHSISQNIHSADGSFLHGIMHRREPDYGNAKYWFHRVGDDPSFPIIAGKAGQILSDANFSQLKSKLIRDGVWDPFALVDACENALRKNDSPAISVLQQIQKVEFQTLLERFVSSPAQ